jgi:hypothetical protein
VTEFPEFRLFFYESGTSGEQFRDSVSGRLFHRLGTGNSFHHFRIEQRGAHRFNTRCECVYKLAGPESDEQASALNGSRCPEVTPPTDSRYVKRFSAELLYSDPSERPFRLAYRGWIGRHQYPNFYQPEPQMEGYWYTGPGAKCGTAEDNFWITAMEFAASPIG